MFKRNTWTEKVGDTTAPTIGLCIPITRPNTTHTEAIATIPSGTRAYGPRGYVVSFLPGKISGDPANLAENTELCEIYRDGNALKHRYRIPMEKDSDGNPLLHIISARTMRVSELAERPDLLQHWDLAHCHDIDTFLNQWNTYHPDDPLSHAKDVTVLEWRLRQPPDMVRQQQRQRAEETRPGRNKTPAKNTPREL